MIQGFQVDVVTQLTYLCFRTAIRQTALGVVDPAVAMSCHDYSNPCDYIGCLEKEKRLLGKNYFMTLQALVIWWHNFNHVILNGLAAVQHFYISTFQLFER